MRAFVISLTCCILALSYTDWSRAEETAGAATPASESAFAFNVRDFGAKGDGVTDDTAAFQNAMEERQRAGGGIVQVPSGRYMIKTHLRIPRSVTLEGTWRAPVTVDGYHTDPKDINSPPVLSGSILLAVEGAGQPDGKAFISMTTNSTLKGMTIFYPNQTKTNPPIAYPWTVQCEGGENSSVIDVFMVNPYQAVDFGSNFASRTYIRNLFAQALYRGVFIDQCGDVGRLENVHLWLFWTADDADSPVNKFMQEHGEGFVFGRSDWGYVTNCFAIGYNIGMHFINTQAKDNKIFVGGGNYLLTQSGVDGSRTAVQFDVVQSHSGVSFSNSQIFGDIIVNKTNDAMIRFTSCGLFGTTQGTTIGLAKIDGTGRVSFDNCHFYCISPESKKSPIMIHALGGRLSIQNCVFINNKKTEQWSSNPVPIVLEADVISAIITGNEFYGKSRITNKAKGRTIIKDNIEQTEEDPTQRKSE
ncbi:MAG: glycosyl hydrolase family 28-related protein [Armatimonadota bacterium]